MYIKRLFLYFCCCFTFLTSTVAQTEDFPKAVITYHDGSFYLGRIVAETDQELILESEYLGNRFTIKKPFIRRIYRTDQNALVFRKGKVHPTTGNYFSYGFGLGLSDDATFQLDMLYAKRLTPNISVGVGGGLHLYDAFFNGIFVTNHFLPVYAYGRYEFGKSRTRPFAFMKAGYGFSARIGFSDPHSGGPMFMTGVGLAFASKKQRRNLLILGNSFQFTRGSSTSFDLFNNPVEFNYDLWYNRIVLKLMVDID